MWREDAHAKCVALLEQRADFRLDLAFFTRVKAGVNEAHDAARVDHEARRHRRRLIALRCDLTIVPGQWKLCARLLSELRNAGWVLVHADTDDRDLAPELLGDALIRGERI